MGKKGSSRKKSKPLKNPVKKLEARLKGYWKNQAWEEFITLYLRQRNKAEKSAAAELWDPAVYNFMLRVAFVERDLLKIQRLCASMKDEHNISPENRQCLRVLDVLVQVFQGNAHPGIADKLPEDLPGPFADLKSGLQSLLREKDISPLSQYVDGSRKKARKGEKHFARAAAFVREFNHLCAVDFKPSSVKPLARLHKNIQETRAALSHNQGVSSQVLKNLEILADLVLGLYKNPESLVLPDAVLNALKKRDFKVSDHPAVEGMSRAFFSLGEQIHGRKWENIMRLSLKQYFPETGLSLPPHLEGQVNVLQKEREDDIPGTIFIEKILEHDVWTPRERMVFLLSQMNFYAQAEDLFFDLEGRLGLSRFDFRLVSDHFMTVICSVLEDFFDLFYRLKLEDKSLLDRAVEQWLTAVSHFPLAGMKNSLDKLIIRVCTSSASDAVLLGMIQKRAGLEPGQAGIKVLAEVKKQRGLLKLSRADFEKLIGYIGDDRMLQNIIMVWKECLSREDYTDLVRTFLYRVYMDTFAEKDDFNFFEDEPHVSWSDITLTMFENFVQDVGDDYPLLGLMLLTLSTSSDPPMPRNAREAEPFFNNLPPEDVLAVLLLNMFEWPSTPYRNTFMARLIRILVHHLSGKNLWHPLAASIATGRFKVLAGKTWEIWDENGLFTKLKKSEDFQRAVSVLRPMLSSSSGKKTSGKVRSTRTRMKQSSLLDGLQGKKD